MPTPRKSSSQSSPAVPTIAGMARSQSPSSGVQSHIPAGSGTSSGSTRSVNTSQASVVPMISRPSPGVESPAPTAQAGRSNGPPVTGVPSGRPRSSAPRRSRAKTVPDGAGSARSPRRSLSPQAASAPSS